MDTDKEQLKAIVDAYIAAPKETKDPDLARENQRLRSALVQIAKGRYLLGEDRDMCERCAGVGETPATVEHEVDCPMLLARAALAPAAEEPKPARK